ncbi:hypothetical protein [Salarchaeum japonicum]|uniref:hypothetical protein n=1 Tax=Salarchaeum japonicum TaxID=555573 RepID=UPI003C75C850
MSESDRIREAGRILTGFDTERYEVFAEDDSQNIVTIWQPRGRVEDITVFPKPIGMHSKAESFLQRASEEDAHLAAAPEWAYNIDWIEDHDDFLFADTGPLFVLGCAPVQVDEMETRLAELNEEYDCYSAEGETDGSPAVPDEPGEFVTPTIIPIAANARRGEDKDALFVQFKNKHMSSRANDVELKRLCEGTKIWGFRFLSGAAVVPWTCSDVMQRELKNEVLTFCQDGPSYSVHVQCNPDPFNKTWVNYRKELFETEAQVSCIVANWGSVPPIGPFGYSGIYTTTDDSTTLESEYNDSYERGGLVATQPDIGCEYLCLIPDDIVSTVIFRRKTNHGTPSGSAMMADLKVSTTAVFDTAADEYQHKNPVYPAPEPDPCKEWREQLNTTPLNRELLTALLRAEIEADSLPEQFPTNQKVSWESVESLNGEMCEELGHLLENHPRRRGAGEITPSTRDAPETIAERLMEALSFAEDEADIVLKNAFDRTDVPVNAEYRVEQVPICLTTLPNSTPNSEIDRARWFVEWLRVDGVNFKPVALTSNFSSSKVKTLAGYEDVSNMVRNPERVDATDGLEEITL